MTLQIETIQLKHKAPIHKLLEKLNQSDKLGYSLTNEWLDYMIEEASESIFIAQDQNQLLGLATCMINEMDHTHAMINIVVDPDYRKQGIGTCLYDHIINTNHHHIKTAGAYVKSRLKDGVKFAKDRGFYTSLYAWQMELDIPRENLPELQHKEVTFRLASSEDSQDYAYVIHQVFGDPLDPSVLHNLLKDPSVKVYLIQQDGYTIGTTTVQFRQSVSVGYIYDVAILSDSRRQGLGTYMLNQCIKALQDHGMKTGSLVVTGENKQALALYERLGFRQVDTDMIMEKEFS